MGKNAENLVRLGFGALMFLAACGEPLNSVGGGGADAAAADATADGSVQPDSGPSDASVVDVNGVCTSYDSSLSLGTVTSDTLNEISGVVASRRNSDVLWVHNDSGDEPRVYALATDGELLATYTLLGASARDWEDLAIGPGPVSNTDYLYLGDIGDNSSVRSDIQVHRIAEPTVVSGQAALEADLNEVETFTFRYPDGAHNCEALVVDPDTGDLYLLTKSGDGVSGLYRASAPLVAGQEITLDKVGGRTFPSSGGRNVTGADISPGGRAFIVRTYVSVQLFPRPIGGSIADALAAEPMTLPSVFELQGEAVGWAPNGLGYYTIREGLGAAVNYVAASDMCAPQ